MPKCHKVQNACKICLRKVTERNGLQCDGACNNWFHYECLNYTAGRIKDIKAGTIIVSCPCPDCKSTRPKEFRTDEAYSCSNEKCPANLPPQCTNVECPINEWRKGQTELKDQTGCALGQCGTGCKRNSLPNRSCSPLPIEPCSPRKLNSPPYSSGNNRTPSLRDIPGDYGRPQGRYQQCPNGPTAALDQVCHVVGQLTDQMNELVCIMKEVLHPQEDSNGQSDIPQCSPPCTCTRNCPGSPCE